MSSLLEDTVKKALLLSENETLKLNCKTAKNLSTTRLALYRAKNKIDLEDEIKISMDSKSLTIQLSKKKEEEELFSVEVISNDNKKEFEKEKENSSDKIQTINIDPEKIKTIRQALSKYDNEKSEIVRIFSEEKAKVLEDQNLSEQEKEEKVKDLLQAANIKIENFNKLAKEESLRFSK
jgi:hypothetical protein